MAILVPTLALARKNILEVFVVEADKLEKQWDFVVGKEFDTTQAFEVFKQIKPLSPAQQTPEGQTVAYDDLAQIYTQAFYPVMFTKGLKYSKLFAFTLQYQDVMNKQDQFARAFTQKKNIVAANINNLGFTSTTYGMNSETLYSTAHSQGAGNPTFSNRPAAELPFGPLALEQGLQELRAQIDPVGQPMMLTGKVLLTVPIQKQGVATRVVNSLKLATTNNNDVNTFIKDRIDFEVIDYYTSSNAWFLRMQKAGVGGHGLFMLNQMPYDMEQLARDDALMDKWVGSESYTVGWKDAHGSWGTLGQ